MTEHIYAVGMGGVLWWPPVARPDTRPALPQGWRYGKVSR